MIDIELIREKPEFVKESFKRRGKEVPLTEIIDLDQKRRTAISEMAVSYTHLTLPTICTV